MSLLDILKSPAARVPAVPLAEGPVLDLPEPDEVSIPLEYPGQILFRPLVQAGDHVARGQVIGRSEQDNCVHASLSGVIREIKTIWSARSFHVPAVVIEGDGSPALTPQQALAQCGLELTKATRQELLRAAGVISPWTTPGCDYCEDEMAAYPEIRHVVILGIHEEPTLFNSELLMQEQAPRLRLFAKRLGEMVPQARIWLAVADRLRATAAELLGGGVQVVGISEEYRHRIERVIVPRMTGVPVPNRESFRQSGLAVLNVENALAVLDALDGVPFTSKTVTLAGCGLPRPVAVRAPLGTRLDTLLASQGLEPSEGGRVLMGGPMKGMAQYTVDTPLSKFDDGVYLLGPDELPSDVNLTCINCGRCTRACPSHIQVHVLARCVEYDLLHEARAHHPHACHECGLCAFVCPSHRPLVQMVKMAKKYGS